MAATSSKGYTLKIMLETTVRLFIDCVYVPKSLAYLPRCKLNCVFGRLIPDANRMTFTG